MSNNKYKILVVEDELKIQSFVSTILETNGYQVLSAGNCQMGKTIVMSHNPDLVILDLGLPDEDGIELIKEVRKNKSIPIIVLSARTDEKEKVKALDIGANDYVTKPFGTFELVARIRVALRNYKMCANSELLLKGKFILKDMVIEYDKRKVYFNGKEISLTQTEFNILSFLSEHSGKVLTYVSIIKAVWGYPDVGSVKKLQVNMSNIRKKLNIMPGDNSYFINELGVGYRMCDGN